MSEVETLGRCTIVVRRRAVGAPLPACEALGRLVQVARQNSGQARVSLAFCWHGTTPRKAAAGIRWTYGV